MEHKFEFDTIGVIHSCFREKFGIPRQPGLVDAVTAELEMLSPYDREEAFRGLEEFSHLWVCFVFHDCIGQGWKPTVRPPRLGGNARKGVFATRSNFRPNPIGWSVVGLDRIDSSNGLRLFLRGGDFLDGTPVLDIKPYIPYSDSIPEAVSGFAQGAPEAIPVTFSDSALAQLDRFGKRYHDLNALIMQVLQYNPVPAYQKGDEDRVYGMLLYDLNVKWQCIDNTIIVTSIEK